MPDQDERVVAPAQTREGAERRNADVPDRRRKPRGGRRATDLFARVANFVYKLLTEPPR